MASPKTARKKIPSWWPSPLAHIPTTDFLADETVTISEISNGAQPDAIRDVHLALLDVDRAEQIVRRPQHHSFSYSPGAGLQLDQARLKIEPLATKWKGGGNHYVQVPSYRFLRHFELVPRSQQDKVIWDDLAKPLHDVVCAAMDSVEDYPNMKRALIQCRRDYLLRYARDTRRAIVALWYEWNSGPNKGANGEPYSQDEFGTFFLPGRTVEFGELVSQAGEIFAELWGIMPVHIPDLTDPAPYRGNAIKLKWPGIEEPLCRWTRWEPGVQQLVFVRDSVLDTYEKRPDLYTVHAENGAVSYKNQWAVSRCQRIGRDLIAVEIKKLYEGAPEEVIKHWNMHAVDGPKALPRDSVNIGTRSKRIVFALLALGDVLSMLSTFSGKLSASSTDFVGLDGDRLKKTWWYNDDLVHLIAHRIPYDMGKDAFLHRCKDLVRLVVEGLNESHLRKLLLNVGAEKREVEELASLKLLDQLLQLARISNSTGLDFSDQYDSIQARYQQEKSALKGRHMPSPIKFLFALNGLRQMDAHPGFSEKDVLSKLGINVADVQSGWGLEADRVYDSVAEALEAATSELRGLLQTSNEQT